MPEFGASYVIAYEGGRERIFRADHGSPEELIGHVEARAKELGRPHLKRCQPVSVISVELGTQFSLALRPGDQDTEDEIFWLHPPTHTAHSSLYDAEKYLVHDAPKFCSYER